jgi:hypothetical protein
MRPFRPFSRALASSAFLLSLLLGLASMASAADFRGEYGQNPVPRPTPRPHLELSDEVQIERRSPPIVQAPDEQCRAFIKRRFNAVGELVIRRIRICEGCTRASTWLVRRTAAPRSLWTTGSAHGRTIVPSGFRARRVGRG